MRDTHLAVGDILQNLQLAKDILAGVNSHQLPQQRAHPDLAGFFYYHRCTLQELAAPVVMSALGDPAYFLRGAPGNSQFTHVPMRVRAHHSLFSRLPGFLRVPGASVVALYFLSLDGVFSFADSLGQHCRSTLVWVGT